MNRPAAGLTVIVLREVVGPERTGDAPAKSEMMTLAENLRLFQSVPERVKRTSPQAFTRRGAAALWVFSWRGLSVVQPYSIVAGLAAGCAYEPARSPSSFRLP